MPIDFRNVVLAPLNGLTASAPAGAIIGLIGEQGSGIVELLRLAGGVAQPASGIVQSGSERRLVKLGDALDLAPAEVIALDQALATQDAVARARALVGLDRLRGSGSTILLASHEYGLLEQLCDEVWWVHQGTLAFKGEPKAALAAYRQHVAEKVRSWGESIPVRLAPSYRRGDGRAEVLSIETLGANGHPTIVWKSGEVAMVRATVRFHEAVPAAVLGLMIRTQIGFEVYGTNTELEHVAIGPRSAGDTVVVNFQFSCDLCPNAYTLTIASHDPDGTPHDWLDDAVAITVADDRYTAGVANLRAKVSLEEPK